MEYPGEYPYGGVPVVINPQRPYRNRPRHASELHNRQPLYIEDANGLLIPAISPRLGLHRSNSASGPRPAPVNIINNFRYDDPSPERKSRPGSYHDRYYSSEEERQDRAPSHERHRSRSRGRGHHHHEPQPPSPHNPEMERKLQRLADLERKEQEDAARQRFEQEQIVEEAKKAKKAKEIEAMKQHAIEEHNAKMLEEELKEKKRKEEEDQAFQMRMRETLAKAGYSEESIRETLEGKEGKGRGRKIMDLTRPTYIKVHRKHLSPDTLDFYELPWEWDDVSSF